jgi:hypothetical protein
MPDWPARRGGRGVSVCPCRPGPISSGRCRATRRTGATRFTCSPCWRWPICGNRGAHSSVHALPDSHIVETILRPREYGKSIACMWLGGLSTSWPGESRDCPARHVPGQSGLLLARNRPASGPDMRTQCPPACSVRDNANEQAQRNGAVGIALHTATRPHGAAKACRTAVGVSGPTLISRRFAVVNHFHDVRTRSRTNRVIRSAEYVGRFGYP